MSGPAAHARSIARRGAHKARNLALDTTYRIDRAEYARHLPVLDPLGRRVVASLEAGDVAVVPIDELGLRSTIAMEEAAGSILGGLLDEVRRTGGAGGLPLIRMASDVPELRAWATERRLTDLVTSYLRLPSTFQGVHARVEQVNAEQVTSEQWHRDLEDRRMLKAFYFPQDVTIEHGPFEYVRDADLNRTTLRAIAAEVEQAERRGVLGIDDERMARLAPRELWRTSEVPARSVVFADPTAFYHHGRRRSLPRPALFFVYTSAYPRHPEHCAQYWNDRYPAA